MNKITIDELTMSQLGGSVDPLRWLACNIDAAHPVTVDLAAVSIENKLSLWAEERGRLVSFNQLKSIGLPLEMELING
jgi:hypothetical protein